MATFTKVPGLRLRAAVYVALSVFALTVLSGCGYITTVELGPQPDPYRVTVKMDPTTLNVPQLGSIIFGVTKVDQPKPVTAFEPLWGQLMHTVLIRRDLQYFRHTYTGHLVNNEPSIPAYFPSLGKFYDYTQFKPGGAPIQTFRANITSGTDPGPGPALVEDTNPLKTQGWLTFRLLKETEPIKSGKPTQLVFNVTERGNQVTHLWSYLEAPGHLFIVDENGDNFTHLAGVSESRGMPASGATGYEPTATAPSSQATTTTGATTTPQPLPTYEPTFAPGIITGMATAATAPTPAIAPVQQTALSSILLTPELNPQVGYGPNVAFTATFPHPGLYKMWLEVQYRAEVVVVDYVVKVQ